MGTLRGVVGGGVGGLNAHSKVRVPMRLGFCVCLGNRVDFLGKSKPSEHGLAFSRV